MRSLVTLACLASFAAPVAAFAQDSVQNGSNAAKASTEVVAGLGASGVQTLSAVAVLPLSVAATGSVVTGESLVASGVGAGQMAGGATAFASTPLPVTNKVIVAQPAPRLPHDAQPPAAKP
ncbi:hypothetical protein [Caulobacter sp. DWR2-3-1b2]|uniref:hypothetical protein n=1 Tax=unclassified Caulobacter TaxID=2648921 RepID=UPI0019BE11C3|nr:hypothetical protein [Caulobacter sp.]